jgi:hypothetical protein
MSSLVYLMLVVFLFNLAPAFAPPTWTVLVFFTLNSKLPIWSIVIVGAICAGAGRFNLARLTAMLRYKIKRKTLENLESARKVLEEKSSRKVALLALFVLSPLPSAQLFEAAGLIGTRLLPLTLAFFSGRIVTYSLYVTGASQLKASGLGELIKEQFTSVWVIIFQLLMIGGIYLLTKINWSKLSKSNKAEN